MGQPFGCVQLMGDLVANVADTVKSVHEHIFNREECVIFTDLEVFKQAIARAVSTPGMFHNEPECFLHDQSGVIYGITELTNIELPFGIAETDVKTPKEIDVLVRSSSGPVKTCLAVIIASIPLAIIAFPVKPVLVKSISVITFSITAISIEAISVEPVTVKSSAVAAVPIVTICRETVMVVTLAVKSLFVITMLIESVHVETRTVVTCGIEAEAVITLTVKTEFVIAVSIIAILILDQFVNTNSNKGSNGRAPGDLQYGSSVQFNHSYFLLRPLWHHALYS